MKNVEQVFKKTAGIFGIICLTAILLSSCSKDNYKRIDPQPSGYLSVINASPDSQPLDFFIDQTQVNIRSISYGNGLPYFGVKPAKRKATFYVANTQQAIKQIVKSDSITLKLDKYYTLYLSNLVSKPDFLLLTDSLVKPAAGTATIRLVNVSPDAPALDLAVNGGSVLVSNKGYKGYSDFVPLKGDTTYTLEVRQTGTTNILTSLSGVKLRVGSVHTVWVRGLASATDEKRIRAGLQTNGFFR